MCVCVCGVETAGLISSCSVQLQHRLKWQLGVSEKLQNSVQQFGLCVGVGLCERDIGDVNWSLRFFPAYLCF